MSIRESLSHERYLAATCSGYTPEGVHKLLDRIEAAYLKEYAEWQEGGKQLWLLHKAHLSECAKRISELETQVPKVVKAHIEPDYPLSYWCDCDNEVFSGDNYCSSCGCKLNWETK